MIDDDAIEIVQADIKQKSKRGIKGAANITTQVEEPASARKHIQDMLYWSRFEPARTDDEIRDRLQAFWDRIIETGEYPLWEKLCIALGHDRKTVWRWIEGQGSSDSVRHLLKMSKEMIACLDGQLANDGKIPQIVYIFRAKNFYGMVDKQEYTIEPKNTLGNVVDADEIERRLTEGV